MSEKSVTSDIVYTGFFTEDSVDILDDAINLIALLSAFPQGGDNHTKQGI